MNRDNIWITIGIILALCLCHTLLAGIYPVRTLFPTIKEASGRRTVNVRNLPVVLSHSGQLLATTKRNVLLNEPTQIELISFKDGSIVRTLEGSGRFGGSVFSPDDSLIAAGTFSDIYIWRTDNGQLLRKLSTTSLYSSGASVNFSTDGKKLVSVGRKLASYLEKQIVGWDVTSGQRLYSLDVPDQIVFAVSPGGKFFAVGRRDSFTQLYNLDDGTLLRQLSLTGSPHFVSDDKILISTTFGGSGGRVLLYQITSDTTSPPLFGLNSNLPRGGISSPDGRFLIGGAGGSGNGGDGDGGGWFVSAPRIQPQQPKVAAYVLWQIDGPYPLPIKKFFVKWGQWPRLFTPDSKYLLAGGDLLRLPPVHPWLANTLLVVSVAMVMFFADRFPPIH